MRTLRDAVYGLAVGDALGVPVEFEERDSFHVETMTGHGTHDKEPGTWSDDTGLTLATCDSLKLMGTVDLEDLRCCFTDWYKKFLMWESLPGPHLAVEKAWPMNGPTGTVHSCGSFRLLLFPI